MLHGYCIRAADDAGPVEGLKGVDALPVRRLDAGPLQIWVSLEPGRPPTAERLRHHESVVRAAMRTATPLPLRYGTLFGGQEEAIAMVMERRDEFLAALDRVRDRVEMSLRITLRRPESAEGTADRPQEPPSAGPGRRFLELRKAQLDAEQEVRRQVGQALDSVEAELQDLDLPTRRSALQGPDPGGTLAHLVHREALRSYHRRIAELRNSRPDLRITLSGPWGPYSFV